jgi:hypothetical protein
VRDVCDPQLQRARATEVSSARTSTHTHTHTHTSISRSLLSDAVVVWCMSVSVCLCLCVEQPGAFLFARGRATISERRVCCSAADVHQARQPAVLACAWGCGVPVAVTRWQLVACVHVPFVDVRAPGTRRRRGRSRRAEPAIFLATQRRPPLPRSPCATGESRCAVVVTLPTLSHVLARLLCSSGTGRCLCRRRKCATRRT